MGKYRNQLQYGQRNKKKIKEIESKLEKLELLRKTLIEQKKQQDGTTFRN